VDKKQSWLYLEYFREISIDRCAARVYSNTCYARNTIEARTGLKKIHLIDIAWDEESMDEVAAHGLYPWEVEEAALYDTRRQAKLVSDDRHGERIQVLGTCEWNGKKLRVFIRMIDVEMGVGRVITAWEV
jgi:hypothetical protein